MINICDFLLYNLFLNSFFCPLSPLRRPATFEHNTTNFKHTRVQMWLTVASKNGSFRLTWLMMAQTSPNAPYTRAQGWGGGTYLHRQHACVHFGAIFRLLQTVHFRHVCLLYTSLRAHFCRASVRVGGDLYEHTPSAAFVHPAGHHAPVRVENDTEAD